jgi:hypothetical protein
MMESSLSIAAAVVAGVLGGVGCAPFHSARVVRLATQEDGRHWRLSVNANRTAVVVSNADLKNRLAHLRLQHNDVILWETPEQIESSKPVDTGVWLARYCGSRMVALYVVRRRAGEGSIFSVPIYHWVAPLSNPLELTNSVFFFEGSLLGPGSDGFRHLLRRVEETRPSRIYILGSLYDPYRAPGPWDGPFELQDPLLRSTLRKSGTELLLPSMLPGF